MALIQELHENIISTLVKFEYQSGSSNNERVFGRKNMIFQFSFKKKNNLLSWKSSLCSYAIGLEDGTVANHPSQGLQTQLESGGVR